MPDEMEVTSFPGFDRRIGDFLKELGMTEGRNTGYPTAFAAMEGNGSGQIDFEMDEERGYLAIHIPVHLSFKRTDATAERMRAYEQRVLAALDPQGMSLTNLARAMGYKGISKKLSSTVDALCKKGLIDRKPANIGSGTTLHPSDGSVKENGKLLL